MQIEISTPALLFPAVSLLLLAYTNRFLATASLIRMLSQQEKKVSVMEQIENLRRRLELTRWMQFFGVVSILLCTISMFGMLLGFLELGTKVFGLSLVTMCASLVLSLWEVTISTRALNMELKGIYSREK
ncbi:MAG: DUF2721 domain-containing protein [Campylobacterales bacterium]|nr:DUF2721 domain-containing protein [Campylobacterales bacterium]